jgi:hypothetical protein
LSIAHEWREALFRDPAITRSTLLVGLALSRYLNKKGIAWPSQETLSADTGYSVRTVRECLRELEGSGSDQPGCLERKRRWNDSTVYLAGLPDRQKLPIGFPTNRQSDASSRRQSATTTNWQPAAYELGTRKSASPRAAAGGAHTALMKARTWLLNNGDHMPPEELEPELRELYPVLSDDDIVGLVSQRIAPRGDTA